jgi:hypothetical protein
MAAIQVKNVPEDLHDALRARAKQEGMSVSEYLLRLLQRDLSRPSQREWLESLKRLEPTGEIDAVAAVHAGRAERDEQIASAVRRR